MICFNKLYTLLYLKNMNDKQLNKMYAVVFIILAMLMFILGCFKDEKDCECTMKIFVSDGQTTQQYFINNVPSDCNGNVTEDFDFPDSHFPTYDCE